MNSKEKTAIVVHARAALLGIGRDVVQNATLVAVDEVIQAVGGREEVAVPAGPVQVYDFSDHYLMPGLIDAHVHLTLPGDGTRVDDGKFVESKSDMELLLIAERNAEQVLASGVTTVRDIGSRGRIVMVLRDAIASDKARGPRLVVSGPPITITGGHCYYFGGEADGVDGIRKRARQILKDGADFIKVMGSGGDTPGVSMYRPNFTVAEMQAAAEEAHRWEKRITVHAACVEAIEIALVAGANMVEHSAMWAVTPQGPVSKFRPDVAEAMVRQGMYVCPTLPASYHAMRYLQDREQIEGLSKSERVLLDLRKNLVEETKETFRRLHAAGVQLVAGTDGGWDINPFGEEYVTCLELAADAGMPNWQVIEHATSRAAAALGLGSQVGVLRQGQVADLVLVPDNPLSNISALRRPAAVFQKGQLVARNRQLLEGVIQGV